MNIMLALLGSTISSIGIVFQKKGLIWIDHRKNRERGVLSLFTLWLFGIFLAYFVSAIPTGIASKVLPPHIITAMAGWGIVVIVFLSALFLKEQIYKSDVFYSLVIVGATAVIGFMSKPSLILAVDRILLIILVLSPAVFVIPAFFRNLETRIRAPLIAVFSGCMGGVAIVIFNVIVRQYFSQGLAGISADILILYVFSAIVGAVAEQFSYKLGKMTVVASIRMSLFIVYPVICSALLFNSPLDSIQIGAIILIIISCYGMFKVR